MFSSGDIGVSELSEASIYPISTGKKLLERLEYQHYIESVSNIVSVKKTIYNSLYRQLLENYAQFVQHLEKPRDKMKTRLLHTSLRRAYGFIQHMVPTVWSNNGFGCDPDRLIYALFSAALLHGIGRTFQDRKVICCNEKGEYQHIWFPNTGCLQSGHYKVRSIASLPEDYVVSLHSVYANIVMPPMGVAWIMEDPKIWMWWLKALEDIQVGFGELGISFDVEMLSKEAISELSFHDEDLSILPPETLEGEKLLAWLKEQLKNSSDLMDQETAGLYHIDGALLVEIDKLIKLYSEQTGSTVSNNVLKEQVSALIASNNAAYSQETKSFLQNKQQKEFQAMRIDYEMGLFETGNLGPVLQVSSQMPVVSGERFFARIGGLAQQFMLGHTSTKK